MDGRFDCSINCWMGESKIHGASYIHPILSHHSITRDRVKRGKLEIRFATTQTPHVHPLPLYLYPQHVHHPVATNTCLHRVRVFAFFESSFAIVLTLGRSTLSTRTTMYRIGFVLRAAGVPSGENGRAGFKDRYRVYCVSLFFPCETRVGRGKLGVHYVVARYLKLEVVS